MSQYGIYDRMIRSFLPPNAEISCLQQYGNQPAILIADIDGDQEQEITAVYELDNEPYMMILKRNGTNWYRIFETKGRGKGVNDLWAAPIARSNQLNLIIGWQADWNVSELDIYHWTPYGFNRLIPDGMMYNRIEIEDMPGMYGRDGLCEIALWNHDSQEAYRVETYRWQRAGLVQAVDVNPYYFPKVVTYYRALLLESPDEPLYRAYLDDALLRSGHPTGF